MKRVPASRYALFMLIAGAGLFWDLYSKQLVFDDLGYPGGGGPVYSKGSHLVFDHPKVAYGEHGESVPYLTGWTTFRLLTSFNEGALWGLGKGYSWVFASMSLLAAAGILFWLFVRGAATSKWLTVALAFVLGGTLGNLYDRLGLHGCTIPETGERLYAVRDFLLFTFGDFSWPVFNFADTYLVTGAIMLVLQSFSAEAGKGKTSEPSNQKNVDSQAPTPTTEARVSAS